MEEEEGGGVVETGQAWKIRCKIVNIIMTEMVNNTRARADILLCPRSAAFPSSTAGKTREQL